MSFSTAAGANYWEMVKANSSVQSGRPFTLMAWVNLAATTTAFSCIASTFDGTANSWEFGAVGAATGIDGIYFYWSTAGTYYGSGGTGSVYGPLLAGSQWYHVCVRYGINGSAATQFDLVQDGMIRGTSTTAGVVAIAAGARKLRIHQSSDNAGAGMPGRTACVRMFDTVLTLGDIQKCRTAMALDSLPKNVRAQCVFDSGPPARTDASVPYDRGPRNLGAFTKVGTVTTSFDPPAFAGPSPALAWVRRALVVPAAGGGFKAAWAGPTTSVVGAGAY